MLNFLKRKKNNEKTAATTEQNETAATIIQHEEPAVILAATTEQPRKQGLFARLKAGLAKTRAGFANSLANLILGKKNPGF